MHFTLLNLIPTNQYFRALEKENVFDMSKKPYFPFSGPACSQHTKQHRDASTKKKKKSINIEQSMLQTISFKSIMLPFALYIKSKGRGYNEWACLYTRQHFCRKPGNMTFNVINSGFVASVYFFAMNVHKDLLLS